MGSLNPQLAPSWISHTHLCPALHDCTAEHTHGLARSPLPWECVCCYPHLIGVKTVRAAQGTGF